ncbi:MAG: helix-turn-helix domain-containing protein [Lachnospiraceae bacterium]|nr:helix-turn-helix domain-containing protein [Lachnospiraceae bacterium]
MLLRRDRTSIMLQLAANLSEARERAGLTQKQLAERTGIYQADISKIERGPGNPSVATLRRLAEGLGMELEIEFRGTLFDEKPARDF